MSTYDTKIHKALLIKNHFPAFRGAESQGWAWVQLKYHASPFLCCPKEARKMTQFSPNFQVISKKNKEKGLRGKMAQFSPDFQVISKKKKKKKKRSSISHFDGPFMKPSGPSHGPLKPHGPFKIHGPRGHCPPLPSLSESFLPLIVNFKPADHYFCSKFFNQKNLLTVRCA